MITFGPSAPTANLFIGDSAVQRVYLGESLVYGDEPIQTAVQTARTESAIDASTLVMFPAGDNPPSQYWGGPDNEPIYWHSATSTTPMATALRFALPDTIPAGATILDARLTVQPLGSALGLGHADDYGEAYLLQDTYSGPISSTSYFMSRVQGLVVNPYGSVRWDYGPTEAGGEFVSPNLASLVQQAVNAGDISALMFIVRDNPNPASTQSQDVNAANSANTPENRPALRIEYVAGDAPLPPATFIDNWTQPTATAGVNSKAGYRFRAATAVTVNELGLFAAPDATSDEVIELWEVGGAMVASVTLTPVDNGEWTYAPITPVTLQAGQSYTLTRHRVGGVGRMIYIDPPSIDWNPAIDSIRVIYGGWQDGEPTTVFEPPNASWAEDYYAVNARFTL